MSSRHLSRIASLGLVLLLMVSGSSFGQITFERIYPSIVGRSARSVQQTTDGGYVIAGSAGWPDAEVYVVKTDSFGDTEWERFYGGSEEDSAFCVRQTLDGGFVVAGCTESYGGGSLDVYVIKTNSLGDPIWTFTWGNNRCQAAYSIVQFPNGCYDAAGYFTQGGALGRDPIICQVDSLGGSDGIAGIGNWGDDRIWSIRATADSEAVCTGQVTHEIGALSDAFLLRAVYSQPPYWLGYYGGPEVDVGYCIGEAPDGGHVVTGYTRSFGAGNGDVYLIVADSVGTLLWDATYGGTEEECGYSGQKTSDGGYVIAGYTESFGLGNGDVYVVKTDTAGDTLWTRTFGGLDPDCAYSIQQTQDGGYIIAGYTSSFGVDSIDVYLIKTGDDGLVERDVAVISLNAPEDTVFTDSAYSISATVQNLLPGFPSFEVTATIHGYADTVEVFNLPPDSLHEVTLGDWIVPSGDSATYTMTVCTHALGDTNIGNDCMQMTIFAHEGVAPVLLSAIASDNVDPIPGIDGDDYVAITFDEPTNRPSIDAGNIDEILALSGGHSWLDGLLGIGGINWDPSGEHLDILLSVDVIPPTVAVGDTITPDGLTILDKWGNPAVQPVVITGSFGVPGVEEKVLSSLPRVFALSQNQPNPFTRSTSITYAIPTHRVGDESRVNLAIYDITGRLVETLVNETQQPGIHQVRWNRGSNASGVYFYRLKKGEFTETRKMVVVD